MNSRLWDICKHMVIYGGLFGAVGGGLLGVGFVSLTYNPFYEMNILLILVGALATMLVGLGFGIVSGFLSGMSISILTRIFFQQVRYRTLYKGLMATLTASISVLIFAQVAYWFGQPFIYYPSMYPSWLWSLCVAIVNALVVSFLVINMYLNLQPIKVKVGN